MVEIGEPFESTFIFLYALSYVFTVLALLSSYALGNMQLQAYGTVYLAMLTLTLAFMRGIEKPANLATGLMLGLPSLLIISAVSQLIRQTWIGMGILRITLPPTALTTENPITQAAQHLGITPALLLTLMMTIPGAVAEEAFFRISLYNLLKPVMTKPYALITQAITFGIYHYYAYQMDVGAIITATLAGLALGIVYEKFHSETSISLSHVLYNTLSIMLGGA